MTLLDLEPPEVIPEIPHKTVAMGADKAASYMADVLRNKNIKGHKHEFGPGILKELHKRILFFYPGEAGQYRVDDDTRIGGKRVAKAEDLDRLTYLFEAWLQDEIKILKTDPENINGALRVAAAAHYGVVEMHPFGNGNGRVARTLMNGVLMLNTHEAMAYGIYIIPVPQMREYQDESDILKRIIAGQEPKPTPYIQSLIDVGNTWNLNPLEIFIAQKWIESIDDFLNRARADTSRHKRRKPFFDETVLKLFNKFEERKNRLKDFISMNVKGEYPKDKVPDFKPNHLNPLELT